MQGSHNNNVAMLNITFKQSSSDHLRHWLIYGALVTFWFQCAVYKSIYLLTYLLTSRSQVLVWDDKSTQDVETLAVNFVVVYFVMEDRDKTVMCAIISQQCVWTNRQ